jgi:hypothetical protein
MGDRNLVLLGNLALADLLEHLRGIGVAIETNDPHHNLSIRYMDNPCTNILPVVVFWN